MSSATRQVVCLQDFALSKRLEHAELRGCYRVRPDLPTNCGSPDWSRYADQGYYFAGDGAKYDSDGAIWLLGRVDDVMNVSGHRISTTEIESALVSHPTVAEAAVVGASDATTGQAIVAFVILRGNAAYDESTSEAVLKELRDHVAKEIGPIAK